MMKPILIPTLLAATAMSASAAITATNDTFSANTLADYSASGGYTATHIDAGHVSSRISDFGDGVKDGNLRINVAASDSVGLLSYTLGTVDASDVGKTFDLTFKVDGISNNFHKATIFFTIDSSQISSTAKTVNSFDKWDEAGTAAAGGLIQDSWRTDNGVGTLTYTIQAGDLGKDLGWQFDSATTSSGGYAFAIDNWNLQAVPEPSSAALLGLGGLALILRRRKG